MADRNFHIIILGESLATRVAGILLAKKGLRVLTLTGKQRPAPPWLVLSGALEQFLEHLGGRSCLTPPLPIQILTPETRTEINGSLPLADELKREFPAGHAPLQALLDRLEVLGGRLEDVLRECRGLPVHGMGSRLRFFRTAVSRKLSSSALHRPFSEILKECADPLSRDFLQALMEGLSLTPADNLTQGEAAILWRGALQPRSISTSAFEALLRQRYEQFRGETEDGDQVQSLQFQRSRLEGVLLKDGRRCTGDYFLIGSPEHFAFLPESLKPPVAAAGTFIADLSGKTVSPLLAPRIILAGNPLLRLNLISSGDDTLTCISQALPGGRSSDLQKVNERLASVFPFSAPKATAAASECVSSPSKESRSGFATFPGAKMNIELKKNLLCCSAQAVLPSLGSTGEVMLGYSCAHRILRLKKL